MNADLNENLFGQLIVFFDRPYLVKYVDDCISHAYPQDNDTALVIDSQINNSYKSISRIKVLYQGEKYYYYIENNGRFKHIQ